ncbi:Lysophospholipid acyltransferase [Stygiomarasmius scandens]|uniref:Lysophospholipid acyltransferase n=1 Tax=Marasmiellus scandens TaxID=2682957 RepID=A0ABR1K280_9AGAR
MDALFVPLADAVGASVDQIKLIACLLVAYPLGSIFVRIPSDKPTLKHLFNLAVSLFFFFPMLKMYSAFFQLLADVLVTYYVAKLSWSPKMPWILFVFTLGHLMVNHIIRALFALSYETMEVTGPQMVLVMKLTTFAWNVVDGRRPAEDLDKWQSAKAVREYPSLLEFLGYCFYFPGVLVGPYLEYADYHDVVHETVFKQQKLKGHSGRNIPDGRKRVGYRKMIMGLIYLGVFVLFGGKYNYSCLIAPWFMQKPLLHRIALTQLFGTLERTKYYAIWTLTEGASIVTGYGFTGMSPSGKSTWNGAANVNPTLIEFPSNFKVLLDSWNMKANVWLRECVYKRVTPKGKKPGFKSSMMTFGTSAFWHGTAVGYYLTFLMGGFITTVARLARANIRPIFLNAPDQPPSFAKRLYDITGTIVSLLILNYVAAPFMLLTWKDSIQGWANLAWYGHAAVFGGLVFFYAGGAKILRQFHPQVSKTAALKANGGVSGATTPAVEKSGFQVPPPLDQVVPPKK